MARTPKKKKSTVTVNFKGVESGGKSLPDGTYLMKVDHVEQKESEEGNSYLSWRFKVSSGKFKGCAAFDNTSLQPQALFRLRGLLESLGEDLGDEDYEIDPADYVGRELMIDVVNEEYQGRKTPKVAGYASADESDSEDSDDDSVDEEEEAPKSKKKTASKKNSSKKADEDEEDEDDSEDDDEEDGEDDDDSESDEDDEESDDDNDDSDDEEESDDSDDDDDEEEEDVIKAGSKVKFLNDKGKTMKGKVVKIVKKNAMVDVGGKEWKVPLDELTAI